MPPRDQDETFKTVGGAGRSFFSSLGYVFSHLAELSVFYSKGNLWHRESRRQDLLLTKDIEDLFQSLLLRAASVDIPSDRDQLAQHLLDELATHELGHRTMPAKGVYEAFFDLGWRLLEEERFADIQTLTSNDEIEKGRYADYLLRQRRKLDNAPSMMREFYEALGQSFAQFARYLPPTAFTMNAEGVERRWFAHVPLIETTTNLGNLVSDVLRSFHSSAARDLGVFQSLRSQLTINDTRDGHSLPHPKDFNGTPKQLVDAYVGNTALQPLFDLEIPFEFTDKLGEHALLVAPSGWGKTQLLQALTVHLLHAPNPPSIIILNSQGKMLDKLQRLGLFAPGQPLSDRLVIIDPEDENPPALNMFAPPADRLKTYNRNQREQIESGTLQTFDYLFSSLNTALTGKQSTIFYPLVKLMFSIPNANFNTLINLLKEIPSSPKGTPEQDIWRFSDFKEDFDKLDEHDRDFFRTEFFTKYYSQTKSQITQRIRRFLEEKAFRRMFSAEENKFDLFDLINRGSVILVNTSKALLGKDGSAFFGRWFLSLLIRAAYERVVLDNPKMTYLFIDEASDYVDKSFEEILSKLRQFNVGCMMAFQNTEQIPIMNSVLANTSVKLFAGDQHQDAMALAKNMRSYTEYLTSMRQSKTHTQFATYVRGAPSAVRMSIPFGVLENSAMMTDEQHADMLKRDTYRTEKREEPKQSPSDEPEPDHEY